MHTAPYNNLQKSANKVLLKKFYIAPFLSFVENQSKILCIFTSFLCLGDLPLGKAMAKAQSSSFKTYLNRVSSFRSCLNEIFPTKKYSITSQLNV